MIHRTFSSGKDLHSLSRYSKCNKDLANKLPIRKTNGSSNRQQLLPHHFSKIDWILSIIKLPKLILNPWHMADNNVRSSAEIESKDPFLPTRLVVMNWCSIQCLTLRAFSFSGSSYTSIKRNSRSCPSSEVPRTWFMKAIERDTDFPLTDEHNPS